MDTIIDGLISNLTVLVAISHHTHQRLRLLDPVEAYIPRISHETRHMFTGIRRTWTNDGRFGILEAVRKTLVLSRDIVPTSNRLRLYIYQNLLLIEAGVHTISLLYETDMDVQLNIQLLQIPLRELQEFEKKQCDFS